MDYGDRKDGAPCCTPDNRILECAVAAGSDYIVSGDKDLLRLGSYDAIRILNVADFLALGMGKDR